jgi:hypothetical protein
MSTGFLKLSFRTSTGTGSSLDRVYSSRLYVEKLLVFVLDAMRSIDNEYGCFTALQNLKRFDLANQMVYGTSNP